MSSGPSEPEKYSLDEMMERLKGSSSDSKPDGELVTREDGSQAIRVRKRKRRTSQPHKEKETRTRRARIIQVSAALVLALSAAGAIGVGLIYANSSGFRTGLLQKITISTGADVDLSQFRMNPKSANAASVKLTWPQGNVLTHLDSQGLTAQIFPTSFFGKALVGEEIIVRECKLNLSRPLQGEEKQISNSTGNQLPIRFKRYRTGAFQVIAGSPQMPAFRLTKSEASFSSPTPSRPARLTVNKGQITVPGWDIWRLDRGFFEFRGGETEVVSLRILDEKDDQGFLQLSGTVHNYHPDQMSKLEVNMEGFNLRSISGPVLGNLVSGQVDTVTTQNSNTLQFRCSENPEPVLDATFTASSNSNIQMKGFPFMGVLSKMFNDEWFNNPTFTVDTKGSVHRKAGLIQLKDLSLKNKTRMAIRGDLSMDASQILSGDIEVGLTEVIVSSAGSRSLDTLFGPEIDGFRWMKIQVSGTGQAPKDDFSAKLSASVETPPTETGNSKSLFEELTTPE